MKYNININQKALSQYEEFDLKDCAILVYCRDMCASSNANIDKARHKGHTWINYEKLMEDMPLLRIKSRNSITPRIGKLEKVGMFTVIKKMVKGHRRVFVKPTTLLDSVFVENTERVHSDEQRVRETVQDYYTNDNNTKDTISDEVAYTPKDYLNTMRNSEKPIDRIIGIYLQKTKPPMPTKAIAQEVYRRHLRAAKKLVPWTENDKTKRLLMNAFNKADSEGQKNDFEFTLETVYKYLTK